MQIHCKYDELVDPNDLKNHPKNRNKHGQDQIERLTKLYEYHGIRHPIIVSKLSGYIVAGHGRKLSALRAGIKEFPVVYQNFDSPEAEYAFLQSDNAIALWADLDLSGINSDLPDLGPDFDLDMLGIQNFKLDAFEHEPEIDSEIEWSKEIDEKNDYIVLLFDSKKKFEDACDKLGIERVRMNISVNGNPNFERFGIGRLINGEKVLEKL